MTGYLLPNEKKLLSKHDLWMPIQWSLELASKARAEKLIKSDYYLRHIFETCTQLNTTLRVIWLNAWINIPLAYTQVIRKLESSFCYCIATYH